MERALTCSDSESYSSSSPLIDKAMTALSHRSWTAKKTNMAEQASCSAYPSSNAFARSHTHTHTVLRVLHSRTMGDTGRTVSFFHEKRQRMKKTSFMLLKKYIILVPTNLRLYFIINNCRLNHNSNAL